MKFSRARYTSRRNRLRRHLRAWRMAFIAVGLSIIVVLAFNWRDIFNYLKTFTY